MGTLRSHQVLVCFAGKGGEEIEDEEKKIMIWAWYRMDELLVRGYDHLLFVSFFRYRILSAARRTQLAARCVPIASRNYIGELAQNSH